MMVSIVYCFLAFDGLFLFATGFQLRQQPLFMHKHNREISATALLSSYLDSLQRAPPAASFAAAPTPAAAAAATATPQAAQTTTTTTTSHQRQHYYAPLEYFDVKHMKSKGPRTTKDWGTPQDATRSLAVDDGGTFFVGAWYCSQGGWPSPNPKAHTEIFYVLDGHGALGDADGVLHYFGPGDTVIIPKGHVGRWDVNSAAGIHKVWAVHEHLKIEEAITSSNPIIRVTVIHYHQLSPQYTTKGHDALYECTGASCSVASQTYYNVGPNKVGVWTSASAGPSFIVSSPYPKRTWFFMLEGVLFITDASTGAAHRCVPGDTVMIPKGWTGCIDVVEGPVKKIWATAEVEK